MMTFVWKLCAEFFNEKKPGSVTIHFGADGRFASWEQKKTGRFADGSSEDASIVTG